MILSSVIEKSVPLTLSKILFRLSGKPLQRLAVNKLKTLLWAVLKSVSRIIQNTRLADFFEN